MMKSISTGESFNPDSAEKIGAALNTVAAVRTAIQQAKRAQKIWAGLPLKTRIASVRKIRRFIVEHADRIATTIARDTGKVRVEALATEILPATMAISYYMRKAKRFLKPVRLTPGNLILANKRSRIVRIPYGVIGIISPWNYPFAIPFSDVIMALLAGNAVVLKTASMTPLTGELLVECFTAAELPEGLFCHVSLPGKTTGDVFLEGNIDKLFFTGSVSTGKYLMQKASASLTPLVLELGGNDAMIVCEDANLYRAAAGAAWAGFTCAGQSCGGVERIYVHEKVYGEFLELLKQQVTSLRVGRDVDFQVDMGAIATRRQKDTIERHVNDALREGAHLFAESACPTGDAGHFLPARVLTEVNHDMLLMREETFGPVVGVMKFHTIDEAIRMANDSDLGLTASIWTCRRRKANAIAKRIQAGVVTINDHLMSHGLAETPWGGVRQSGIGRTHGKMGFDEMTAAQVVVNDIMPGVQKNMWWYPYSERLYNGLRGIIRFLYGNSIGEKAAGLRKMLNIVPRYFTRGRESDST